MVWKDAPRAPARCCTEGCVLCDGSLCLPDPAPAAPTPAEQRGIVETLLRRSDPLRRLTDADLAGAGGVLALSIRDSDDDPPIGTLVLLIGTPAENQAALDRLDNKPA